jgi:AGZA family xanthine/uracil permease-like MFS transporter
MKAALQNAKRGMLSSPTPLAKLDDINGLIFLFTSSIGNFILVIATLIGFGWPEELVFYRVVPGLALGLTFSGLYYTWMGYRLAKKEGRNNVTSLPSGISTTGVFIYLFAIIAPLQFGFGLSPEETWKAGMAACFIGGAIEASGSFLGPIFQKYLPRVAMLSVIGAISVVWIATKGFFEVYQNPLLTFPVLIIVVLGLIGGYKFGKIPALVLAMGVGIAIAFGMGEATLVLEDVGRITLPRFSGSAMLEGFKYVVPMLGVIIPLEINNFMDTLNGTESARVAGDNFSIREAQLVDGAATMISAVFGGITPNTVYYGHNGMKATGNGIGYTWMTALAFGLSAFFGLFNFFYHLIPFGIVAGFYIWTAIVVNAQACVEIPRRHVGALGLAMVPVIANLLYNDIISTLRVAGVLEITPEIAAQLTQAGIVWRGIEFLNHGMILTSMLWAAILAFIVDRQLRKCAGFCGLASVLTFFGLLHAPTMGFNAGPMSFTIGYLVLAAICLAVHYLDVVKVPTKFDYV